MPTNLYGPGDNYHPTNSHVLPALVRRFYDAVEMNASDVTCWGTGSPMREFLHVHDLGDACVFTLEHWQPSSDGLSLMLARVKIRPFGIWLKQWLELLVLVATSFGIQASRMALPRNSWMSADSPVLAGLRALICL